MLSFEFQISNQRSADIHTNSWGLRTSWRDLLQDEDLSDQNSSEDGPLEKAAEAGAIFAVLQKVEIANLDPQGLSLISGRGLIWEKPWDRRCEIKLL